MVGEEIVRAAWRDQPVDSLPGREQVMTWLEEVCDPEIPVLSIADLGIIRDVVVSHDVVRVVVTPTYSGCPAVDAITEDIKQCLARHGVARCEVTTRLAPAWSTDWMSARGRERLSAYGIAPPHLHAATIVAGPSWNVETHVAVGCPLCGSTRTRLLSQFGSTACKALYRCNSCLETFDHFKNH
jgi:ring-1,2-phenylacetyl-CoA epoxidase subunit PaaD